MCHENRQPVTKIDTKFVIELSAVSKMRGKKKPKLHLSNVRGEVLTSLLIQRFATKLTILFVLPVICTFSSSVAFNSKDLRASKDTKS